MPPSTWAIDIARQVGSGKRPPAHRPTDTAGLRWQPETWPMAIGHGQHGQPEGQRHADKADAQLREGGGQNGRAASAQHQPGRADEFRCKFARQKPLLPCVPTEGQG